MSVRLFTWWRAKNLGPRAAVLGAGAMAFLAQAASPATRPPVDVFLLAGQSNMAGADAVVEEPPGFVSTAADRRTLFTCAPVAEGARSPRYYPWGELRGHRSTGDQLVHGPEIGFARRLHESGVGPIAIVKVWANFPREVSAWPWREGGELFTPWMEFVEERLAELRTRGFEPRVRGFIWHQGIDDAIHATLGARYGDNLRALILALRRRQAAADTPFVLARSVNSPIARRITGAGPDDPMAVVRRTQFALNTTIPHVSCIGLDDLPNVNQHHFSAESQLVIGRRLGEAYLAMAAVKREGPHAR
ncbi:MAG: hypothetical protein RL077_4914 [Verrucomicrobiota bacterium]